eukprot:5805658-Pyramimonas_sp.AAC.1
MATEGVEGRKGKGSGGGSGRGCKGIRGARRLGKKGIGAASTYRPRLRPRPERPARRLTHRPQEYPDGARSIAYNGLSSEGEVIDGGAHKLTMAENTYRNRGGNPPPLQRKPQALEILLPKFIVVVIIV